MLNFLKDYGIKEQTIETLNNNYPKSTLYDLSNNEEDCLKIINYLKQIGITNYEELLTIKIDIFIEPFPNFIKKLSKFNIPVLVELINNDINNIDILYKYE